MLKKWFAKKPKQQKLEVFVRHCNFSAISHNKVRQEGFSKEKCHQNLLKTVGNVDVHFTYIIDTFHGSLEDHFLSKEKDANIVEIKEGTEASSFLRTLEYIKSSKLHPKTIVYLLEDDYLHRENWPKLLLEVFDAEKSPDYVTLYDHKDKYFFKMYDNLTSKIFQTKSSHWRTIPSTTNTFAMRYKTLIEDMAIHKKYSENQKVSKDHAKFCELTNNGKVLVSPMPGFSTHCEVEFESPCINWEKYLSKVSYQK